MIMHVKAQNEPNQEIETMHATASLTMEAQTVPAMISPSCDSSSFAQESDLESLSIKEYGNCIQGFLVGLCLEGVLALCLYGVYHIRYVIR
jgi:tetrahydromethanopterin S-methyltransferase subunit B